jgi:dCTP deaminase
MSLLSDRDIVRNQVALNIGFGHPDREGEPMEPWRLQPASIELTLNGEDDSLLGYALDAWSTLPGEGGIRRTLVHHAIIDPESPPPLVTKPWWAGDDGKRRSYLLQPGEFLLGSTAEGVALSNGLYGTVEGKSSLGRLGLMIHITAGHVDPGWRGRLTLEFFNAAPRPIRLWAGMRVAQLLVGRLSSPSERSYGDETLGSHYQDSPGTVQGVSVTYMPPVKAACGLPEPCGHNPRGGNHPLAKAALDYPV